MFQIVYTWIVVTFIKFYVFLASFCNCKIISGSQRGCQNLGKSASCIFLVSCNFIQSYQVQTLYGFYRWLQCCRQTASLERQLTDFLVLPKEFNEKERSKTLMFAFLRNKFKWDLADFASWHIFYCAVHFYTIFDNFNFVSVSSVWKTMKVIWLCAFLTVNSYSWLGIKI